MGEVRVSLFVTNLRTGARSEEIPALADTGATLCVIPRAVLEELGIRPIRRVPFVLADGRRVSRDAGDAGVGVNGESVACHVLFGDPGDATLLGLTALEQLGLGVDPVHRRLIPADLRM